MTGGSRVGTLALKDPSLFQDNGWVNGAWWPGVGGGRFEVTDPATGESIALVANMVPQDVSAAIDAAAAALPGWRARSAKERCAILKTWHSLIHAHVDDLAMLMTREQGKPLTEAKAEVLYAASFVEWFAEEAKRAYGEIIPSPASDRELLVFKEPIGVVAAITPWNFPAAMITRKCAPALAVGCTVVVKPAEATPLTALALAELGRRAGLPAGVFNVVLGDAAAAARIGEVLCSDTRVRKLSFTGSTEVGRLLYRQCAPSIKKLSLELGGNAPFIVFADADLEAAIEGLMAAKFRNAGQTCICPNRIFVQSAVVDRFAQMLADKGAGLRGGSGLLAETQVGPLIEAAAVEKVEAHLAEALSQGARVLVGGRRHPCGGLFFEPTVLVGATPSMQIAREETFGPVAPIFSFESEEEVVELANATEFGLAAYFFSRDVGRVFRVARALEAGMVAVNAGAFSNEVAPFGGVKQSGLGREGARHGMDEYLEIKYVTMAGLR